MTVLLPCCSFLRVFDTVPENEVLTLPELTAALRRFEVKTSTASKIEREIARIRQARERLQKEEMVRGKFMGKLYKEMERARKAGRDGWEALDVATDKMIIDADKSAKRDLRLWSPALYRPGADKRGKDGVTHVSCLVLDYDDGTAIREASTTWSSWFHLVYTTWSHASHAPRFRLALPLAFPVPAEDWSRVWAWAEEHAHFTIDPSMKSPAATYALPAVRSRDWPREAFSRPGAILDPVDEGILERRTALVLEPKRPPIGTPSAIRGEDPEKDYIDHADPDAVYFVDEPWEAELDWEASPELVAAAKRDAGLAGAAAVTPARSALPAAPKNDLPGTTLESYAPPASLVPADRSADDGASEPPTSMVGSEVPKEPAEGLASRAEPPGSARESERREFERRESEGRESEGRESERRFDRPELDGRESDRLEHDRILAVVDALERLAHLHETGFLSDDEVARAKEIVLAPDPGESRVRPILSVDFDGVLHAYTSGWNGPTTIADPPVDGAIAWLVEMDETYDVVIMSVRNAYRGAPEAMRAWLIAHGLPTGLASRLRFPTHAPDAVLHLDDRGLRFEGRFPSFDELGALRPWYADD